MKRLFTLLLFFFLFSCTPPLVRFPEVKNLTHTVNPEGLEKAKKMNGELLKQNSHLTLVASCKYSGEKGADSFGFILFTEYPDKFNMEIIYLAKMVMRMVADGNKASLFVPMEKRLYVSYREEAIRPDYPLFKLGFEALLSIISYIPSGDKTLYDTLKVDEDKNYCLETVSKTGFKKEIYYNSDFSHIPEMVVYDNTGKKYHIIYSFKNSDYQFPQKIQIFDFAEKAEMVIEFEQREFFVPQVPDLFKEKPDPGISVLELK